MASPQIGEWCSIEVVHQVENGEYVYNVTVDGVVKTSAKNSDPAEFSNVLVYASDPWTPTQPSHIRALTIQTILVTDSEYLSHPNLFVAGLETRTLKVSNLCSENTRVFISL